MKTETWLLRASAGGQNGDFGCVIECCRHVLTRIPDHPQANSMMGNALAALGHHDEARAHYRKALARNGNDVRILNNLGNALFLAGEFEEAVETLARVVRLMPDYAEAHNNLANTFKALNRNNEAIDHYQRALKLNPAQHEVYLNLGGIYNDRLGFPEGALYCFRQALALTPDNIEALYGIANTLRFLGQLNESLEVIRTILKRQPGDTAAISSEADALERLGQFDDAYQRVRKLLEMDQVNAMALEVFTRLCWRYNSCDEALKKGERLLSEQGTDKINKQTIHFALGTLNDKLGDFDTAFMHFRQGNDLAAVPYDHSEHIGLIDRLIAAYSPSMFLHLPRPSRAERRPVFIIGMPRSGTSLTEQILASHPNVYGAGELNELNDMAARLPMLLNHKSTYPECIGALSVEIADRLVQRYSERLNAFSRDARKISDKMPHNFMNLGLIALLFPEARIVHCVRDPRDTCLSIYFQNFGWLHPYATKLENLGHYYREYQRLMKHWESVLELPIMTVHYERMITDQEQTSRELVAFCDLPWDDRCLQFHHSGRHVATASYDQVRQPIYRRSVARWQQYANHLGPLFDALDDVDLG